MSVALGFMYFAIVGQNEDYQKTINMIKFFSSKSRGYSGVCVPIYCHASLYIYIFPHISTLC